MICLHAEKIIAMNNEKIKVKGPKNQIPQEKQQ